MRGGVAVVSGEEEEGVRISERPPTSVTYIKVSVTDVLFVNKRKERSESSSYRYQPW